MVGRIEVESKDAIVDRQHSLSVNIDQRVRRVIVLVCRTAGSNLGHTDSFFRVSKGLIGRPVLVVRVAVHAESQHVLVTFDESIKSRTELPRKVERLDVANQVGNTAVRLDLRKLGLEPCQLAGRVVLESRHVVISFIRGLSIEYKNPAGAANSFILKFERNATVAPLGKLL